MSFPKSVRPLVEVFRDNLEDYKAPGYKEARLRKEFIDPLFEALGWDMSNSAGYAEAYKDVVHEDLIKIGGGSKAPDYAFRVGGTRKFFVETKAPNNNVGTDAQAAYQLRRYGWSAKLSLCILTNFEEFVVYDCRYRPNNSDLASNARVFQFKFSEYENRWPEIAAIFSREAVLKGSFDRFAADAERKRGTTPVDEAFLEEIEGWRAVLANNIVSNNRGSVRVVNEAVQRIIDRIVFLRIAEDRGIETYGRLRDVTKGAGVYKRLGQLFVAADSRYNSGLFHFDAADRHSERVDDFSLRLNIDDRILRDILTNLYYPDSPYEFSVVGADILGQVYERFLGKIIQIGNRSAKIVEKPEVRKAGGVYYTPTHIVRYIIDEAVKEKLNDDLLRVNAAEVDSGRLRILDPACGSGSFLVEAYQYLLDWYLQRYVASGPSKYSRGRAARLYDSGRHGWRLTIAERRRILLSHIFGVDLDPQAVEVTKLSLLLKVLEGELSDAVARQMDLFNTRALPDLGANIKCGNSIVGTDIQGNLLAQMISGEEWYRNKPFDWAKEFSFLDTEGGFNVIIGNPPYIDSEWMSKYWAHERKYCVDTYEFAKGNWDIFCIFIGRCIQLLGKNGVLSMIVPNKLMSATYARYVRRFMLGRGSVVKLRDYSSVSVFPVAVYPIVFVFKNGEKLESTHYERMRENAGSMRVVQTSVSNLKDVAVSGAEWQFNPAVVKKSRVRTQELGDVAEISDGATVAEAYELLNWLTEKANVADGDLLFVNSGTIDPYLSLWGVRPTRYIKRKFDNPVLSERNARKFRARRVAQARTPKIVVANMTRRIEAIYDSVGNVLAGKATNVIQTDYDKRVLLAILNSDYISRIYESQFHGRRMAGGYLQVVPATLRQLRIPTSVSGADAARIGKLVEQMMGLQRKIVEFDGDAEVLRRAIEPLKTQIENEVVKLYGANKQI